MKYCEGALNALEAKRTYSRKELLDYLKKEKPNLVDTSYSWIIHRLIQDGLLRHDGQDAYSLPGGDMAKEYEPTYSNVAKKLMEDISRHFPNVAFTVFETSLLNDFLNHLIAQNTIFIQVEKDSAIYVFRHLQDNGYGNILYKPSRQDLSLYWSKGIIIVTDLVSEAPLRKGDAHAITLEKMLVDIIADKSISSLYEKAEYPEVIEQSKRLYLLDKKRLHRYAKRRNKYIEVFNYLGGRIENADT